MQDVTLIEADTGFRRTVVPGADGSYNFPSLRAGSYRLEIRLKQGTRNSDQFTLRVGQNAGLDLDLTTPPAPAQPAPGDTITGETAPPPAEAQQGDIIVTGSRIRSLSGGQVGINITPRLIEQLPQNSRNFLAFADLAPGVRFIESSDGSSRIQGGAQGSNSVNVFIDGVSQKDYVLRGGLTGQDSSPGNPFPQLAIGEYQVLSSNYKAELDQVSSVAIIAGTKSGTNEFHGEGFFDFTNQNLRDRRPTEIFPTKIAKIPRRTSNSASRWAGRSSGRRAFLRQLRRQAAAGADRHSADQRRRGVEPACAVSRHFRVVQLELPPGPVFRQDRPGADRQGPDRADRQVPQRNRRADRQRQCRLLHAYAEQGERSAGCCAGSIAKIGGSTTCACPMRMSPGRRSPPRTASGSSSAPRRATAAACRPSTCSAPGPGWASGQGAEGLDHQDDFTWTGVENHTFKVGAKAKWVTLNSLEQNLINPLYLYDTTLPSASGFNDQIPYSLQFGTNGTLGDPRIRSKNFQLGLYAQDDWDVTDRLTLNLGLRWDYERTPAFLNYVTTTENVNAVSPANYPNLVNADYRISDYISTGSNRKAFKGAWQPRVGFTYRLDEQGRFAVFGGYGRSYDRNQFDFLQQELSNGRFQRREFLFQGRHNQSVYARPELHSLEPGLSDRGGRQQLIGNGSPGGREFRFIKNDLKIPIRTSSAWACAGGSTRSSWRSAIRASSARMGSSICSARAAPTGRSSRRRRPRARRRAEHQLRAQRVRRDHPRRQRARDARGLGLCQADQGLFGGLALEHRRHLYLHGGGG